MDIRPCTKCDRCSFPIKRNKKYKSYTDLLFDRKVCNIISRGNTSLPYRDTQERLATLKAKVEYSKRIAENGKASCQPYWYYPTVDYDYPKPKSFY